MTEENQESLDALWCKTRQGGHMTDENQKSLDYIRRRKRLSGVFVESALPNEYLVEVGQKNLKPVLGGRRLRLFRKFIRIPAYVQTLHFTTDNANVDYQGIGIDGYASWRINPEMPEIAIRALDFFDDMDPMQRTNEELKTICVEAVRHVIANMTIDGALKKKDEIAENLKNQLKTIESKWGIVFDQVGIEKVRVMSPSVFENLQSQFRNNLRLEVEKKRIDTDRQITGEENTLRERTETEKQETDKKLSLQKIGNESKVKGTDLEEKAKIAAREREIAEEKWRKETEFRAEKEKRERELQEETYREAAIFRMEQNQREFELSEKKNQLDLALAALEENLAKSRNAVETVQSEIERKKLEVEKLRREIGQAFTQDALAEKLIGRLPEIYANLGIDHYTVLDTGKDGGISPVGKLLSEVVAILRQSGFEVLRPKQ